VAAGIIFSLLSSFVINVGNLIEKKAVSRLPEISARRGGHLIGTVVRSKQWMLGFVLCMAGLGLQVLAFALAPISIVQSIFNVGIVVLVVFSRLHIGERLHRREWVGLALVIASLLSVSVTLGGAAGEVGLKGSGLSVILVALPTTAAVVIVVLLIKAGRGATAFLYGIAAGLLYGVATLGVKGASTMVVHYGVLHALPRILASVYPYVFLIFSLFGLLLYQTGLQRSRISVVGSMSDVVCSTYLVAVGTVVFGEQLPTDPVTLALRLAGFVGVLAGSIVVASGGKSTSEVMTPAPEVDLGLGRALVTEMDTLIGRDESPGRDDPTVE
jgi:multidrug transporter EmrE-like cation transporter